jgi:lipopolysaccharide/colanic/teichoic acid biosynthesis glycosyltransferase
MHSLEKYTKRLFDFNLSLAALIFTLPLIFFAWVISTIETSSNGMFFQKRIGKDGKIFNIIKIKTMKKIANIDTTITSSGDTRITKSGAFFRKTKIDELPQLWNVLMGQMSFVGPRPDVPGYADRLQGKDRVILSVRPGITGPAQLSYKNEEEILAKQDDIVKYNNEVIWPDKVAINMKYIENYSFFKDIYYIWKTVIGGDVKY